MVMYAFYVVESLKSTGGSRGTGQLSVMQFPARNTCVPKKTDLMKNKIYLLFARLKKTYVTNELKRPCEIVDNSA